MSRVHPSFCFSLGALSGVVVVAKCSNGCLEQFFLLLLPLLLALLLLLYLWLVISDIMGIAIWKG